MSTIVTLKKYSNRFREEYQRRGLTQFSSLIFSYLAGKSYTTNSSCWFHLSLHDPLTPVKPKVPAQFGFMQFEEAIHFFKQKNKQFPWMYQENEMQVAAECGHRFPCYTVEGKVVAYLKVGIIRAYFFDFEQVVHLSPGTATFYDGFVAPELRCQGLGSAILSSAAQSLQQEGFDTVLNQVPLWNTASKKMNLMAGFTEVSQTRYVRLFGRQMIWNNPRDFPLHFTPNERKERELRLDALPKLNWLSERHVQ